MAAYGSDPLTSLATCTSYSNPSLCYVFLLLSFFFVRFYGSVRSTKVDARRQFMHYCVVSCRFVYRFSVCFVSVNNALHLLAPFLFFSPRYASVYLLRIDSLLVDDFKMQANLFRCDEYVCSSICLSTRTTRKSRGRTSPNLCMLPVAVAWSSSGGVAIRTSGFLDNGIFPYHGACGKNRARRYVYRR